MLTIIIGLDHAQWKKALPWVVFGWCVGWCFEAMQMRHERPEVLSSHTEWVVMRPTFLPPTSTQETSSSSGGIWEGADSSGRSMKVWMKCEDSLHPYGAILALVRLSPLPTTDLTDSFDFRSFLRSHGVTARAEIIQWKPGMQQRFQGLNTAIAVRWRRVLSAQFHGDGGAFIWGVFGGDKSSLPRKAKEAFQRLGLAHLLAVSGYNVGLVSTLFLLFLKSQNR